MQKESHLPDKDLLVKASATDPAAGTLDEKVSGSLVVTNEDIQLVGDESTPGTDKYYGTNGAGEKGYFPLAGHNYGINQAFANGDLTAGVLTVTHNFGTDGVLFLVKDNNGLAVLPDEFSTTSTVATIDLSSFGTISGVWSIILLSSGASGTGVVSLLNDIQNVNAPVPTQGQVLLWDQVTLKWIASSAANIVGLGNAAVKNIGTGANDVASGTHNHNSVYMRLNQIQGSMTGSIIPTEDETFDIGSPTMKVRDIYMSNNTIHMGDNSISVNNGQPTVNGSNILVGDESGALPASALPVYITEGVTFIDVFNPASFALPVASEANKSHFYVYGVDGIEATSGSYGDIGGKLISTGTEWKYIPFAVPLFGINTQHMANGSVTIDKLTTSVKTFLTSWSNFTGLPTTLAGFGISDAYNRAEIDTRTLNMLLDVDETVSPQDKYVLTFNSTTGKYAPSDSPAVGLTKYISIANLATLNALPTAGSENKGYLYEVGATGSLTSGPLTGTTVKTGNLIYSTGAKWVYYIVNPDKQDVGLGNVANAAQLEKSLNLGDLDSAEEGRNNLGLTAVATKNIGTGANDVAAGDAPASAVGDHETAYDHSFLPSTAQKAALTGTGSQAPSAVNPYLVTSDVATDTTPGISASASTQEVIDGAVQNKFVSPSTLASKLATYKTVDYVYLFVLSSDAGHAHEVRVTFEKMAELLNTGTTDITSETTNTHTHLVTLTYGAGILDVSTIATNHGHLVELAIVKHTHDATDIVSGLVADARISESSVTQHEAAINHDALAGYNADEHVPKNDTITTANNVWSAQKIEERLTELEEGLAWQNPALDFFDADAALPVGPSLGDRYVCTTTGNGWTEDYIYEWLGSAWEETIPVLGTAIGVLAAGNDYRFNGTEWVLKASSTQHDSLAGIKGGVQHLTTDEKDAVAGSENPSASNVMLTESAMDAGLSVAGHKVSVSVDDSTIEIDTTLKVKAGGVGATQLASDSVTSIKIADANVTRAKLEAELDTPSETTSSLQRLATSAEVISGAEGSAVVSPATLQVVTGDVADLTGGNSTLVDEINSVREVAERGLTDLTNDAVLLLDNSEFTFGTSNKLVASRGVTLDGLPLPNNNINNLIDGTATATSWTGLNPSVNYPVFVYFKLSTSDRLGKFVIKNSATNGVRALRIDVSLDGGVSWKPCVDVLSVDNSAVHSGSGIIELANSATTTNIHLKNGVTSARYRLCIVNTWDATGATVSLQEVEAYSLKSYDVVGKENIVGLLPVSVVGADVLTVATEHRLTDLSPERGVSYANTELPIEITWTTEKHLRLGLLKIHRRLADPIESFSIYVSVDGATGWTALTNANITDLTNGASVDAGGVVSLANNAVVTQMKVVSATSVKGFRLVILSSFGASDATLTEIEAFEAVDGVDDLTPINAVAKLTTKTSGVILWKEKVGGGTEYAIPVNGIVYFQGKPYQNNTGSILPAGTDNPIGTPANWDELTPTIEDGTETTKGLVQFASPSEVASGAVIDKATRPNDVKDLVDTVGSKVGDIATLFNITGGLAYSGSNDLLTTSGTVYKRLNGTTDSSSTGVAIDGNTTTTYLRMAPTSTPTYVYKHFSGGVANKIGKFTIYIRDTSVAIAGISIVGLTTNDSNGTLEVLSVTSHTGSGVLAVNAVTGLAAWSVFTVEVAISQDYFGYGIKVDGTYSYVDIMDIQAEIVTSQVDTANTVDSINLLKDSIGDLSLLEDASSDIVTEVNLKASKVDMNSALALKANTTAVDLVTGAREDLFLYDSGSLAYSTTDILASLNPDRTLIGNALYNPANAFDSADATSAGHSATEWTGVKSSVAFDIRKLRIVGGKYTIGKFKIQGLTVQDGEATPGNWVDIVWDSMVNVVGATVLEAGNIVFALSITNGTNEEINLIKANGTAYYGYRAYCTASSGNAGSSKIYTMAGYQYSGVVDPTTNLVAAVNEVKNQVGDLALLEGTSDDLVTEVNLKATKVAVDGKLSNLEAGARGDLFTNIGGGINYEAVADLYAAGSIYESNGAFSLSGGASSIGGVFDNAGQGSVYNGFRVGLNNGASNYIAIVLDTPAVYGKFTYWVVGQTETNDSFKIIGYTGASWVDLHPIAVSSTGANVPTISGNTILNNMGDLNWSTPAVGITVETDNAVAYTKYAWVPISSGSGMSYINELEGFRRTAINPANTFAHAINTLKDQVGDLALLDNTSSDLVAEVNLKANVSEYTPNVELGSRLDLYNFDGSALAFNESANLMINSGGGVTHTTGSFNGGSGATITDNNVSTGSLCYAGSGGGRTFASPVAIPKFLIYTGYRAGYPSQYHNGDLIIEFQNADGGVWVQADLRYVSAEGTINGSSNGFAITDIGLQYTTITVILQDLTPKYGYRVRTLSVIGTPPIYEMIGYAVDETSIPDPTTTFVSAINLVKAQVGDLALLDNASSDLVTEINLKADQASVTSGLALKADKVVVGDITQIWSFDINANTYSATDSIASANGGVLTVSGIGTGAGNVNNGANAIDTNPSSTADVYVNGAVGAMLSSPSVLSKFVIIKSNNTIHYFSQGVIQGYTGAIWENLTLSSVTGTGASKNVDNETIDFIQPVADETVEVIALNSIAYEGYRFKAITLGAGASSGRLNSFEGYAVIGADDETIVESVNKLNVKVDFLGVPDISTIESSAPENAAVLTYGADLATTSTIKASCISPANAFDANDTTYATVNNPAFNLTTGSGTYIGQEFITPKAIRKIHVLNNSIGLGAGQSFRVAYSDTGIAPDWTDAGVSASSGLFDFILPNLGSHKFWIVYHTGLSSAWGPSSIEFYEGTSFDATLELRVKDAGITEAKLAPAVVAKLHTLNDTGSSASEILSSQEVDSRIIAKLNGVSYQTKVISIFDPTTATPATPTLDDRYIAAATANGWTTQYIYQWDGSAWDEIIPQEEWQLVVDDEDLEYIFNGTVWVDRAGRTNHASLNNVQGGQASEHYHLTSAEHTKVQNLQTVATSGAYADLTGKPTLSTVAGTGAYADLTGTPTLATVAISGSYNDLSDTPTAYTLPTATETVVGGLEVAATAEVTAGAADDKIITPLKLKAVTDPINTAIGDLETAVGDNTTALADKADSASLATVASTGAYSDLSGTPTLATVAGTGAYADLTGIPSLASVATSGQYADLAGKPTLATVATSGAYADLSGTPTLATVAGTGSYADLLNKPDDIISVYQLEDATAGHTHTLNVTLAQMTTLIQTGTVNVTSEQNGNGHTHVVTLAYSAGTITATNIATDHGHLTVAIVGGGSGGGGGSVAIVVHESLSSAGSSITYSAVWDALIVTMEGTDDVTVTLPAASTITKEISIKKIGSGSGVLTVTAQSGETVGDLFLQSLEVSNLNRVILLSNGSDTFYE